MQARKVLVIATTAIPPMCEGCRFYKPCGCGSVFWGKDLAECPVKRKGNPFQCPGGKCYDCDQCKSDKHQSGGELTK